MASQTLSGFHSMLLLLLLLATTALTAAPTVQTPRLRELTHEGDLGLAVSNKSRQLFSVSVKPGGGGGGGRGGGGAGFRGGGSGRGGRFGRSPWFPFRMHSGGAKLNGERLTGHLGLAVILTVALLV